MLYAVSLFKGPARSWEMGLDPSLAFRFEEDEDTDLSGIGK